MPVPIYNAIVRSRDGGIYALDIVHAFYELDVPKLIITIVNPAPAADKPQNWGKFFLDIDELTCLIIKLRAAALHPPAAKTEVMKSYKGGKNKDERWDVPVISRIFEVIAEGGKFFFRVTISRGEQAQVRNKQGELVDGVVKPVAGGVLQTSSFSLTAESALDIAYRLYREYAAWRCAVNVDAMQHPDKYQH